MVIGDVDIGLKTANITTITQANMVDLCIYLLLLVVFMKLFMATKEVILVLIIEDVDLGLKRPATIIFKIAEKLLMVISPHRSVGED